MDTDGPDGSAGTADDDTFYVWDGNQGSGEWVIASTDDVDIHLPPKNLLPSGGWSATDGDGDTSGTGVPIGWSLSSTPTIGYSSSDTSEGDTLELNITATGSTNEGISYTLKGLLPSTTYQVYARAHANTAGNTCSIRTTGADTTQVDETTAGVAAFEELEGTFTVDSTPTDVVIILENDTNDAAVCDFTHVAVWKERNVALTEPGVSVSKDEAHVATDGNACSTSYTGNCLNIVNIDVTPPSDGYNVIVIAQVGAASTDSNGVCAARIYDDSAAAAVTEIVFEPELAATPTMIYMSPFPLTAGVTVNYKVDMKEGGSGGDNCRFQDDISSDTVTTSINAILIPSN
ncbi:MAG: hypothetical protein GY737_00285 [Desulfobacteraceae bacterium]|nr:hypothetical protein [Desulfobacteraceae bacterium]